jgi:hypothetical protein
MPGAGILQVGAVGIQANAGVGWGVFVGEEGDRQERRRRGGMEGRFVFGEMLASFFSSGEEILALGVRESPQYFQKTTLLPCFHLFLRHLAPLPPSHPAQICLVSSVRAFLFYQ